MSATTSRRASTATPRRSTTTAGNPYLLPATAWQFDLTCGMVFRAGRLAHVQRLLQVTIHNFFYQDVIAARITSNGVTLDRPRPRSGQLRRHRQDQGLRDRLPADLRFPARASWPVSACQANYTYIDSSGLPNSLLNGGTPVNNSPIGAAGNLPLEQLSKHNANVAAFYEKGRFSIRAAYNWRSRFLLTAADVIFPYYLDLQRGYRAARRFDLLQRHGRVQDRCPGGEPPQRGHQDLAGLHGDPDARRRDPTS